MKSAADSTPSPENVLLFSSAIGDTNDTECTSRLSAFGQKASNVLFLSYERSPEELLKQWNSRVGTEPAEFGIITVGKHSSSQRTENPHSEKVVSIANPECLGRLQTAVYLFLDQWSVNDHQAMFCFDSITAMLRYVDRTTAFRFFHSLTDSLRRLDVTAHFHMNPEVHDEETIAIFRPLFDTVVGGPQKTEEEAISPDVLSILFDSPRRRDVCRYLADVAGRPDVSAIADRIAEWESEGTSSNDTRKRVHITLQHVHLPKLIEAGVIELDGEMVIAADDTAKLKRYNQITDNDDSVPKTEPTISDAKGLPTTTSPRDESNEAYWTVYGTARDSVVVTLAWALGAVLETHPTKLRPVLYDVVDIDALQRLAEREETSLYATFNYEGYEVVVDGGEIRLYESS